MVTTSYVCSAEEEEEEGGVQLRAAILNSVGILVCVSPNPSSSCTLMRCTWRLVDMNSSFLSAFRLLALNEGPDEERSPCQRPDLIGQAQGGGDSHLCSR